VRRFAAVLEDSLTEIEPRPLHQNEGGGLLRRPHPLTSLVFRTQHMYMCTPTMSEETYEYEKRMMKKTCLPSFKLQDHIECHENMSKEAYEYTQETYNRQKETYEKDL